MNRYARQMILPQVGVAGQARLSAARVVVVGAGGLGCPALQYLAGAGVGRIDLIDADVVAEHNLHRQPLYTMGDLSRPKVLAARDRLQASFPEAQVTPHATDLNPANVAGFIAGADVVLDAADSYAVSYTLSDACRTARIPLISASVLGQGGYVGGFCGGAPSLRAVFPMPEGGATCASAGVMGPVVGMIGAAQAQMALAVLLDLAPSPLGQMMTFDMGSMRPGSFRFDEAPEPGRAFPFLAVTEVDPADLVIDLRSAEESPRPAHENAHRMLPEAAHGLRADPGQRVVLCCTTGLRAWRVAENLSDQGFERLALLAGRGMP